MKQKFRSHSWENTLWLAGKDEPSDPALPACSDLPHYPSATPLLYLLSVHGATLNRTTLRCERAITLTPEQQREPTQEKVQRNSKQVVRGQRCCAIGTAVPLLAARAELWEGPGSRYDDLLYRGPQNIPSYQNDLNIGAWEGKHSPSIILKINPPLYSSPESINNVARGGNLQQRFILILWLLFISL